MRPSFSLDDEDSGAMLNEDYELNDDFTMYNNTEKNNDIDSLGDEPDRDQDGKVIETNIDNELVKENHKTERSKTTSAAGHNISVWCFDNSSQETHDMLLDINNDEKKIYEDLCYVTFSSTDLPEVEDNI